MENLPAIEDVRKLEAILLRMGAQVDFTPDGEMRVDPRGIQNCQVTFDMVRSLRASYYLLGALLGRYKEAAIALPGGCAIGQRPIDQHIKGFRALGADVRIENGIVKARATKLTGAEIYLDVVSVGAHHQHHAGSRPAPKAKPSSPTPPRNPMWWMWPTSTI